MGRMLGGKNNVKCISKAHVDLNFLTSIKRNRIFVNTRGMWGTKLCRRVICYKLPISMASYSRRL